MSLQNLFSVASFRYYDDILNKFVIQIVIQAKISHSCINSDVDILMSFHFFTIFFAVNVCNCCMAFTEILGGIR